MGAKGGQKCMGLLTLKTETKSSRLTSCSEGGEEEEEEKEEVHNKSIRKARTCRCRKRRRRRTHKKKPFESKDFHHVKKEE